MNRLVVVLAGALMMLIHSAPLFGQSGWTKAKNSYFVKLGYSFFASDVYYNPDGDKLNTSEFRQQSINLYGEYGITDRITVIVNFPVLRWNGFETTETVSGIGDLRTEFKYALFRNKIPVALSIAPEFPTGPSDLFAQNKEVSFEQINLPTGDGEFNIWTTLAGSTSFHPVPAYISASAAHNLRTSYEGINFQDQLKFSLEFGYQVIQGLWVNALLNTQTSVGEKNPVTDFVRGDGTSYTAWGLGAAYEFIPQFSLNVQFWDYAGFLFPLENIYSAPTLSVGIFYEVK